MKTLIVILMLLSLKFSLPIRAQNNIFLFGDMGNNKDTVLYYFDNNKDKIESLYSDENGKYALLIKSSNVKTVTFYFKQRDYCLQTLNLIKIREQNQKSNTNKVQNDLSLIKGFACIRHDDCGVSQEVLDQFSGKWVNKKMLSIEFNCLYKREFIEGGIKYLEEGVWSGNENQIELEPKYIENIEAGTYLQTKRKLILNYKDGQLLSVEDKEFGYVKNN